MNNLVLLTAFVLVSSVCAMPLPQDLTLAEFRSLRDEEITSHKVKITPSYAQVNMHLDMDNIFSYIYRHTGVNICRSTFLLLYYRSDDREETTELVKSLALKDLFP